MFVNRCSRQASRLSSSSRSAIVYPARCRLDSPGFGWQYRNVSSASTESQQSVRLLFLVFVPVSTRQTLLMKAFFCICSCSPHPSKTQIQPSSISCKRSVYLYNKRLHLEPNGLPLNAYTKPVAGEKPPEAFYQSNPVGELYIPGGSGSSG